VSHPGYMFFMIVTSGLHLVRVLIGLSSPVCYGSQLGLSSYGTAVRASPGSVAQVGKRMCPKTTWRGDESIKFMCASANV
jgi:hypothetical protein